MFTFLVIAAAALAVTWAAAAAVVVRFFMGRSRNWEAERRSIAPRATGKAGKR